MEALMRTNVVGKTLIAVVLGLSAACTRKVVDTAISPAPGSATSKQLAAPLAGPAGATTARGAVEGLLVAAKTQDLRGMSAMWGNDKGPTADRINREELEKRLIVMQCMLAHENWEFAEDRPRLITGGRQEYMVTLQQKTQRATTKLTTVAGQGRRWFVEDIDLAPLKDFCR